MTLPQTLLLAVVQGIAEFLPISSSGHLTILQAIFESTGGSGSLTGAEVLEMNIALHFGTLLSILVVYRKDLREILRDHRLILLIVIATIPVGVVGLLFKDQLTASMETPLVAGCALILTAGLLLASHVWDGYLEQAERERADGTERNATNPIGLGQAILVGCFQALGIVPGVSRSGSTIAGGLFGGMSRNQAARFSFLIAIPAISGATLLQLKDVWERGRFEADPAQLGIGLIVSFAVGVIALAGLLKLISRRKLHYFAAYCLIVGAATIIWQLGW